MVFKYKSVVEIMIILSHKITYGNDVNLLTYGAASGTMNRINVTFVPKMLHSQHTIQNPT